MQIYPTDKQEKQLLEWCKISHDMWNFNEIDRDINAAINIKNRAELTLSSNAYLL